MWRWCRPRTPQRSRQGQRGGEREQRTTAIHRGSDAGVCEVHAVVRVPGFLARCRVDGGRAARVARVSRRQSGVPELSGRGQVLTWRPTTKGNPGAMWLPSHGFHSELTSLLCAYSVERSRRTLVVVLGGDPIGRPSSTGNMKLIQNAVEVCPGAISRMPMLSAAGFST